jgi:hypothetical protein
MMHGQQNIKNVAVAYLYQVYVLFDRYFVDMLSANVRI